MTLKMTCPHCGKEIELTTKPATPVQKKKPAHAVTKKKTGTKAKTKVKKK